MSRINVTSDPLSDTMHAMNSRLMNRPISTFSNAVRNSTIISTDASNTLIPASSMDSRISLARR